MYFVHVGNLFAPLKLSAWIKDGFAKSGSSVIFTTAKCPITLLQVKAAALREEPLWFLHLLLITSEMKWMHCHWYFKSTVKINPLIRLCYESKFWTKKTSASNHTVLWSTRMKCMVKHPRYSTNSLHVFVCLAKIDMELLPVCQYSLSNGLPRKKNIIF